MTTGRDLDSAESRARARVKDYTDFMWHLASFVIVNAFLWALDLWQGGGLDWAFWPTIGWGIGLAFHAAAYFIGDSSQSRRYQKFLSEERSRQDL